MRGRKTEFDPTCTHSKGGIAGTKTNARIYTPKEREIRESMGGWMENNAQFLCMFVNNQTTNGTGKKKQKTYQNKQKTNEQKKQLSPRSQSLRAPFNSFLVSTVSFFLFEGGHIRFRCGWFLCVALLSLRKGKYVHVLSKLTERLDKRQERTKNDEESLS